MIGNLGLGFRDWENQRHTALIPKSQPPCYDRYRLFHQAAQEMNHPLEIDVATLQGRLEKGDDLLLIDCREPDEWQIGHLKPAMLLPMSEIAGRVEELRPSAEREVVVYCHHGGRSLRVTQWLRQQGFDRASSLAGGIDAWSEQIDPSIPRY